MPPAREKPVIPSGTEDVELRCPENNRKIYDPSLSFLEDVIIQRTSGCFCVFSSVLDLAPLLASCVCVCAPSVSVKIIRELRGESEE